MNFSAYRTVRFLLLPIIYVADYLQTNYTKYFTPMNMGPVRDAIWKKTILKNIDSKSYVLDYGCGVGFFCKLFDKKKYIGIEINKKFIERARIINNGYKFLEFKSEKIKNYKNKINVVFINNVLHHMSNVQISNTFTFFKKNLKKNTKFLIIEPTMPEKIFSLQFFLKALDIGNFIRTKDQYLKNLKQIKILKTYHTKFGIADALIILGKF